MKEKKTYRVDVEEINGAFKASFFVNGRLIHKTYPQHSKQDDKDFFIFLDLKQMFGVHHATAMTAVCRGELPQPKTLIINGSRVKGFQFDDVNNFFEIIRGVSNGKPTSTMGTQNVQ